MFVSTHQAGGWPYTGAIKEVGRAEGEGYTINLPLPGAPASGLASPGRGVPAVCKPSGVQLGQKCREGTRPLAGRPLIHRRGWQDGQ